MPVMGYVVGSALSTGVVARTQRHIGRQRSFQLGLVVAALSAAVCAYAVTTKNFWLLVAATVVAGFYNANAALYRFAGPELAAPSHKERAISLVLAGGIVGAFAGPNLANGTRSLLAVPFAIGLFVGRREPDPERWRRRWLVVGGYLLLTLALFAFFALPGIVLYLGQRSYTYEDRLHAMPIDRLWT